MAAVLDFVRGHPREFSLLLGLIGVCFSPIFLRRRK